MVDLIIINNLDILVCFFGEWIDAAGLRSCSTGVDRGRYLVQRSLLGTYLVDSNVVLLVKFILLVKGNVTTTFLESIGTNLINDAANSLSNFLKIVIIILVKLTQKIVHDILTLSISYLYLIFLYHISLLL